MLPSWHVPYSSLLSVYACQAYDHARSAYQLAKGQPAWDLNDVLLGHVVDTAVLVADGMPVCIRYDDDSMVVKGVCTISFSASLDLSPLCLSLSVSVCL